MNFPSLYLLDLLGRHHCIGCVIATAVGASRLGKARHGNICRAFNSYSDDGNIGATAVAFVNSKPGDDNVNACIDVFLQQQRHQQMQNFQQQVMAQQALAQQTQASMPLRNQTDITVTEGHTVIEGPPRKRGQTIAKKELEHQHLVKVLAQNLINDHGQIRSAYTYCRDNCSENMHNYLDCTTYEHGYGNERHRVTS